MKKTRAVPDDSISLRLGAAIDKATGIFYWGQQETNCAKRQTEVKRAKLAVDRAVALAKKERPRDMSLRAQVMDLRKDWFEFRKTTTKMCGR